MRQVGQGIYFIALRGIRIGYLSMEFQSIGDLHEEFP